MYETVIFDLDGTLLDTLDDLHAAVNAALSACGLPPRTKAQVRGFVGDGIVKLIERALGDKQENLDEAVSVFKAYYGAHCKDNTAPYRGIVDLLRTLKARGVKTAVVSNKADFAVKILADEYFGDLLLAAVGENESAGIRKKPAPDSLLAVMQTLGATAEKTVYVGDSEVDLATAHNAGVACLSVTWGFKDRAFLQAHGAQIFIDEPSQILAYCQA